MVCKAEGIFLAFHCRRIWQKGSILKYPSKQVEGYDLALLETQIIFPLTDFSFLCPEVHESKSNWGYWTSKLLETTRFVFAGTLVCMCSLLFLVLVIFSLLLLFQ